MNLLVISLILMIEFGVMTTIQFTFADENNMIKVGNNPVGIAVNPTTNMIYVANSDSSTISVIDGSSNMVVNNINVNVTKDEIGPEWKGMIGTVLLDKITDIDINPNTNIIYVAKAYNFNLLPAGGAASGIIIAIDGSTNKIIDSVYIDSNVRPAKLAVDANDNLLYFILTSTPFFCTPDMFECGARASPPTYALNGSTNTWAPFSPLGVNSMDIAFNPKTNDIYNIHMIEPSHTTLTVYHKQAGNPFMLPPFVLYQTQGIITGIAFNLDRDQVYIVTSSSSASSSFTIVDGSTGKVAGIVDIPKPSEVTFNAKTSMAYVAHPENNQVSVIDTSIPKIIKTITISQPVSIAINPDTNLIYVVNQASNSVTVIDGMTNTVIPEFPIAFLIFVLSIAVIPIITRTKRNQISSFSK